ncbi:MAG: bacterioferritin [Microthrixaceae bacterium]|mgnify:CR=1 FL=1|jgi:bacterioferritin|nr:bacterioferritin [Actinomycetota bacterium]HMS13157.1 bacterioferritin [Microthrixaceae bacterium]HMT26506.1 bacterioferritin [Microthrixaceae bacterium]HMT59637.1 bacterioferritin [Microthrixaceae bacterium]
MPGSAAVVEALNEILTAELTAINQYFVHSKLCESWGFGALAAHNRAESIDEMRDADRVIDRILFLGGLPNLQRIGSVAIGETVPEQFEVDLALEREAIERYNAAIALAVAESDNGTRELLEQLLVGEETHADWLQTQLELIERIGVQNYLASQLGGG